MTATEAPVLEPMEEGDGPPPPEGGMMTLRMPRQPAEDGLEWTLGNLDFGPSPIHTAEHAVTNIKFNDGYAFVSYDHPALDALLRRYPQIEHVVSEDKERIFVCPTCDRDFASRAAFRTHQRSHR